MINALHLFWIIPCAAIVGFMLCALLTANDEPGDKDEE